MPAQRVIRWFAALGAAAGGFAVSWWVAETWLGLDQSGALTLATAAGPLLAAPFAWWASQPIHSRTTRPGRPATATAASLDGPDFVFLCYSRTDSGYVAELAATLQAAGIPVWLDQDIPSGLRGARLIQQHIERCAAVVAVMTPDAETSDWVGREIAHAEALGKPILPLLLSGRPFFELGHLQYENVTAGQMPGASFLARLHNLTSRPVTPATQEPVAPLDPVEPAAAVEHAPQGPELIAAVPSPAQHLPAEKPALTAPAIGTMPNPVPAVAPARQPSRRRAVVIGAAALATAIVVIAAVFVPQLWDRKDSAGEGAASPQGSAAALVLSPDGRRLYVVIDRVASSAGGGGQPAGHLVVIDTSAGKVVGEPLAITASPYDAVISPDGNRLYVTGRRTRDSISTVMQLQPKPSGIYRVKLAESRATPSGVAADSPRSLVLSPDGKRVYVADPLASAVHVAAAANADIPGFPDKPQPVGLTATISLAQRPGALAITPDGSKLYVAAEGGSTVTAVDTGTNTVSPQPIPVGLQPRAMAVSRDGTRLYVANWNSDNVAVIDTATDQVVNKFHNGCGARPTAVAVSGDGTEVYVTCDTASAVAVHDAITGSLLGSQIVVGHQSSKIAVSPDGSRIYVATIERYAIKIAVVDTKTRTLLGAPIEAGTWRVTEATATPSATP